MNLRRILFSIHQNELGQSPEFYTFCSRWQCCKNAGKKKWGICQSCSDLVKNRPFIISHKLARLKYFNQITEFSLCFT